jgi:hypothetical protein
MTCVGTGVFEREELVAHAKEADFDAAHEHTQRRPRPERARFGHPHKGHRFSTPGLRPVSAGQGILSLAR